MIGSTLPSSEATRREVTGSAGRLQARLVTAVDAGSPNETRTEPGETNMVAVPSRTAADPSSGIARLGEAGSSTAPPLTPKRMPQRAEGKRESNR